MRHYCLEMVIMLSLWSMGSVIASSITFILVGVVMGKVVFSLALMYVCFAVKEIVQRYYIHLVSKSLGSIIFNCTNPIDVMITCSTLLIASLQQQCLLLQQPQQSLLLIKQKIMVLLLILPQKLSLLLLLPL